MPNHVTNKLTVRKGSVKVLSTLYDATFKYNGVVENFPFRPDKKLYDILTHFSFNKIKPQPKQGDDWDWYDWNSDNWDTKWDAYVLDNLDEWANDDETVNLVASFGEFQTAWSPPVSVIQKLQKMFPDYSFALDYIDEQFLFCGTVDIKGENHYSEEEKDFRYYGSYLLNHSHRELDEIMEGWKNDVDEFVEKNS